MTLEKRKINCRQICFLLAALLSVLLLFGVCPKAYAAEDSKMEKVAENSSLRLYADMETGHFFFEDISSGKRFYSTPADIGDDTISKGLNKTNARSEVIVRYITMQTEASSADDSAVNSNSALSDGGVAVEKIDKGIRVTYTFKDYGFSVPVAYTIESGYMCADILAGEITESKGYNITSVELLPYLMAVSSATEGYMFIPDGSGALINLNSKNQTNVVYEQFVYGADYIKELKTKNNVVQNITMPTFGIADTSGKTGLLAVINEGSGSAKIYAGAATSTKYYNNISAKMIYRQFSSIMMFENDWQNRREIWRTQRLAPDIERFCIRYYPLSGEKADYNGMAAVYREYLLSEGLLKKSPKEPALTINLYGAASVPSHFLGFPISKLTALTTFNQAKTVIDDLSGLGIDRLNIRYIGIANNGLQNKKITSTASPLRLLGGQKGLQDLLSYAEKRNTTIYPDYDITYFQTSGNGYSVNKDSVLTLFGEKLPVHTEIMRSVFVPRLKEKVGYYMSPKNFVSISGRIVSTLQSGKLGSAIGFGSLGKTLYSDLSPNGIGRNSAMANIEATLGNAKEKGLEVLTSGGNAYTFPYTDIITSIPICSSGMDIFDMDVPFLQMVLHGYLTYTTDEMQYYTDPDIAFLKAVETGSQILYAGMSADSGDLKATPFDSLYSSTVGLWEDKAAAYYRRYKEAADATWDQAIVFHRQVAAGLYETIYANGVKIIVNYNESPVQGIPAKDFKMSR